VGNRYGLKIVSHIENISLEVMFENQERKNFVTRGSYGGSDSKGVFHGHGDTKNLKDIMKLKYFNEVYSLVLSFQKEYGVLPVILLTSIIHMNDFMTITKNDSIIKESIDGNLFDMTLDEVASNIKPIDHKAFEALIHMKIKQYHNLLEAKQSSDDEIEIKKALVTGRVETLLISSEHISRSFDEYINIGISKGSEILVLNHIECLEDFICSNEEYTIVFEDDCYCDDVELLKITFENIQNNPDFDTVYLGDGCFPNANKDKPHGLLPVNQSRCTEAIVYSKKGAKKILDYYYKSREEKNVFCLLDFYFTECYNSIKDYKNFHTNPTPIHQATIYGLIQSSIKN
jgi:hypothetical protein